MAISHAHTYIYGDLHLVVEDKDDDVILCGFLGLVCPIYGPFRGRVHASAIHAPSHSWSFPVSSLEATLQEPK